MNYCNINITFKNGNVYSTNFTSPIFRLEYGIRTIPNAESLKIAPYCDLSSGDSNNRTILQNLFLNICAHEASFKNIASVTFTDNRGEDYQSFQFTEEQISDVFLSYIADADRAVSVITLYFNNNNNNEGNENNIIED